jgi:hypothetical protein
MFKWPLVAAAGALTNLASAAAGAIRGDPETQPPRGRPAHLDRRPAGRLLAALTRAVRARFDAADQELVELDLLLSGSTGG